MIRLEIISSVDYGYNMRKKNTLNRHNPSYADLCKNQLHLGSKMQLSCLCCPESLTFAQWKENTERCWLLYQGLKGGFYFLICLPRVLFFHGLLKEYLLLCINLEKTETGFDLFFSLFSCLLLNLKWSAFLHYVQVQTL